MADQVTIYSECIAKQLEEVNMLSSIYCTPGEMHIFDPGVISDFNEFLQKPTNENVTKFLKSHLDFNIKMELLSGKSKDKCDIRVELPHLYPIIENALVTVHIPLLSKNKEIFLKREIEQFIETMDKSETYVFQILSWLQDQIQDLVSREASEFDNSSKSKINTQEELVDFERLWIYSHHLKSKTKRQEIIKQSRNLELSGFSRPGKPGIICVEGLKEGTQELWRIIRAMHWQKIFICKVEAARKARGKIDKLRRFEGFKEQLFCDDLENEEGVMDMGLFIKYLETHSSGYMKKELFGLE